MGTLVRKLLAVLGVALVGIVNDEFVFISTVGY
jgi:hypothetical protein